MKNRPEFISHLQHLLGSGPIREVTPIYGGHINHTCRLTTSNASFLVKVNSAEHFPDMFASEAAGLKLLADSRTVSIPTVITYGNWENLTYLLMEWIEPGPEDPAVFELLGHQLAEMHRHSTLLFGLDRDHKAWLTQSNRFHEQWVDFFILERLQPMLHKAIEKGNLTTSDQEDLEKLYIRIPQLFPEEPPALLHGDLWKGNRIIAANGRPYLIDPAVYYGHREMDIAMTRLFGGFDESFYRAYNAQFPLGDGWEERTDLWNLYPLLILNVYGPDYRDRLRAAVRKYI